MLLSVESESKRISKPEKKEDEDKAEPRPKEKKDSDKKEDAEPKNDDPEKDEDEPESATALNGNQSLLLRPFFTLSNSVLALQFAPEV